MPSKADTESFARTPMINKTLFSYARNNSRWHFDPSRKSMDFQFVGNHIGIPQEELFQLASLLEQKGLLKEVILGERKKKYDNRQIYDNDELTLLGYDKNLSFMKQITVYEDVFEVPSYIKETIESINLKDPVAELMIQYPGQLLPWHCDLYQSYRKRTKVPLSTSITRYLVALSDWDWGQYFLCGNSVWHQWKAGDIITWDYLMYHCSSNCGRKPKITLSVTGIK